MTLQTLILTNFEGVKFLEINPDGKSMSIYGDNGTGKTTIADAQAWLLFDKDSVFTPNFTPKMRDSSGEEIHNIDCSVKAVYRINGTNVTLEKVMKEDWKKKRGSTEAVFSGHKVLYYIDGVPKKEKEFTEFLSSVSDIQNLMLLSVSKYLPEVLDIKKRRAMLMGLTSDIDDFDVINSEEALKPLLHLMLKPGSAQSWYGIDEYLKICKAGASEVNSQLKDIPGRIDEVSRTISDATDMSEENIRAEIARINANRSALQAAVNGSENEMILSIQTDISKKAAELVNAETEYTIRNRKINDGVLDQIRDLAEQETETERLLSKVRLQISEENGRLSSLERQREDLLKKYSELSAAVWQGDTVCPTCGQAIPQEQLEKAKEQFNLNKSDELEKLNAYGKEHCSKDMISACKQNVSELEEKALKFKSVLDRIKQDISNANSRLVISVPFEDTDDYKQRKNEIDGLKAQITMLVNGDAGKKREISQQISELDGQIAKLNLDLASLAKNKQAKERIAELEAKEKSLGQTYARYQQGISLCELFSRTKADMLTDRINGKFKNVRFRLFKAQINGGIADDCEVMALTSSGYIPYSTANNAARINAGLEIIRAFGRELDLKMPVFADNAESVTKLDTDGLQVIRLVVSENDKTLRFETEEN